MLDSVVREVTERIIARSKAPRAAYTEAINEATKSDNSRKRISCGNLAHSLAGACAADKIALQRSASNLAIVTAYNDMLSAHQPFGEYPDLIKQAAREVGAVAQVAGGVPAMCDGITQGESGMELSLFSRDVIAQATAIALSHNVFDGILCLGVCDKIVPGMLIGSLSFGHLPTAFVPAGPMPSGIPNKEKAHVRALFAEGKASREELLKVELQSYHSPGTCTFYGTANSNQMLMEFMGLHVPGAAFVNPGTKLRNALTRAATATVAASVHNKGRRLLDIIEERALVNGIVGLLATGGSTNHTMHLVAIARAGGIRITWDDFDELSNRVPLLARIYPNGDADINQFQAAGGLSPIIRDLLQQGLLHSAVNTVFGDGLGAYTKEPFLSSEDGCLTWRDGPHASLDSSIIRPISNPFSARGGLRVLRGNFGRAVIKTSAVALSDYVVEAPARVFDSQDELISAFKTGALNRDFIAVVRFQGPRANGMPELHKLIPTLRALQGRGHRVALVSDGRMSGASGQVPAAIHVTPEAAANGPLARIYDGDIIRLDVNSGSLNVLLDTEALSHREPASPPTGHSAGYGRELFHWARRTVSSAETGALSFFEGENGGI